MKQREVTLSNLDIMDTVVALGGIRQGNMIIQRGLSQEMIGDIEISFGIAQNHKTIRQAGEDYQEFRLEILKRHAQVDEQGELISDPETGKLTFHSPEAEKQAEKDIKELNAVERTLSLNVFSLNELKNGGLKNIMPEILEALGWMINTKTEAEEIKTMNGAVGHRNSKKKAR